ncbi:hypothetical protein [Paenibacillus wulumuqiensis]|uniref:hypothetical protein n=1 Tax=Paenibacillus wulumuqiensis TaxID=1567107 RepID=UPI00069861E2|nr:hypothetical protein [Paenibacillus wulumuqiensis]
MKEMLESLMQDRIHKLSQLEDRKLMRQLVNEFLVNMVDYQEQMLDKLEQRVLEESKTVSSLYDIYTTVYRQEDWDAAHEFLHPVLPEDVQPQVLSLPELLMVQGEAEQEPKNRLFRLFLEMDSTQVLALARSGRMFRARVTTDAGVYHVGVQLRPSTDYQRELERLYHNFQVNGLAWRTVHHPYIYKFVDVMLHSWEDKPQQEESIVSITVDMEEYEPYQRPGWIPVWNVQRLKIKNSGFPIPALDRIHYEHIISLHKYGTEHGYLADGAAADIRYIKRSPGEMVIVSPGDRSGFWDIIKINRPVEQRWTSSAYPLLSNGLLDQFVHHHAAGQILPVRTMGELTRIVRAQQASAGVELHNVQVRQDTPEAAAVQADVETVELNPFLGDNIRLDVHRPVLELSFRRLPEHRLPAFLHGDQLAYLTAELQRQLPEYRCKGVWL